MSVDGGPVSSDVPSLPSDHRQRSPFDAGPEGQEPERIPEESEEGRAVGSDGVSRSDESQPVYVSDLLLGSVGTDEEPEEGTPQGPGVPQPQDCQLAVHASRIKHGKHTIEHKRM